MGNSPNLEVAYLTWPGSKCLTQTHHWSLHENAMFNYFTFYNSLIWLFVRVIYATINPDRGITITLDNYFKANPGVKYLP